MPTSTSQTRPLVEGALLAAIAVVLILVGVYVPVLGMVIVFLWPVPIIVIQLRYGLRTSILTIVVAGLLLVSFLGPLHAATILMTSGIVGLAFGAAFRRRLNPVTVLMIGAGGVTLSLVVSLAIAFLVMGINPLEMQLELMEESMGVATDIYRRFGVGTETTEQMRAMWDDVLGMARFILPALLFMAAVVHAFLNYQVASMVLRRLGYDVRSLPPFAHWRLPVVALFGYVAAFVFIFLEQQYGQPVLKTIGLNLYSLFSIAFLVQGLSVGYFYLSRYNVARWLRVVILGYALFVPFLSQVALWLGMLDILFDVRRLARATE